MKRSAPGQCRRAQDRADVGAEAAAGDQHQALDQLRKLVGELQRDTAAEGVPDQRGPLVAERQQQVAQAAGEAAERVVPAAGLREPVAGEVGGDHRVAQASGSITASQFSAVPAMPWISSRTGPEPASM